MQRRFAWSEEKNQILKDSRDISFEDVILALENHRLMDKIDSPTHDGQKCYVVNIDNYAYIVPYVDDSKVCFLKTIYPSRKHTKFYNLKG